MVSIVPVSEKAQEMAKLKTNLTLSGLHGNYKDYKNTRKKLASLAVQDFDTYKNTTGIKVNGPIPIFSKAFWKITKVILLDKFRIKTADEKKLMKLAKEEEQKQKFKNAVRARIEEDYRRDIDTVYKEKIDALVAEKTDKTMTLIPQFDLNNLAEEYIKTKGENAETLVNTAIKYSPGRGLMNLYKKELEESIFNQKFIKEAKK